MKPQETHSVLGQEDFRSAVVLPRQMHKSGWTQGLLRYGPGLVS